MRAFLMQLEWWHWWIAAAVLAALETFMPGAVAIWFAVSAAVVGALRASGPAVRRGALADLWPEGTPHLAPGSGDRIIEAGPNFAQRRQAARAAASPAESER